MKISAVMDFVARNFSLAASKKGIELTSEIAPGMPDWIMADEMRIRQILFNLVGNAVKFTRSGRVTMRVEKSGESPDTYRIQVMDTGVGIPKSDLPRITRPFTQTGDPPTNDNQGSGLGLAIVTRLIELMGGDLRIKSRENKGTTVSVLLPLKAAQEPMPQARDSKPGKGGDTSGMSVLLVEDDPVNMFMLQKMLKVMGHEVHQAENGPDALAALERRKFDAVVMDVHMPGMDGLETTRTIRESRKPYADVPILALTAHALNTDQEKILDAGMDGYLAKPATMEELGKALYGIVRG
jgi:two-component system sensor histidine kinase EvgS